MLRRSLPFIIHRINRPPPHVCSVGAVRFCSTRGAEPGGGCGPTVPQRGETLMDTGAKALGNHLKPFDVFDLNAYPPFTKESDEYVGSRRYPSATSACRT